MKSKGRIPQKSGPVRQAWGWITARLTGDRNALLQSLTHSARWSKLPHRLSDNDPLVRTYLDLVRQYRLFKSLLYQLLPAGLVAVGLGLTGRYFFQDQAASWPGIPILAVGILLFLHEFYILTSGRRGLERIRRRLLDLGCTHPDVQKPIE